MVLNSSMRITLLTHMKVVAVAVTGYSSIVNRSSKCVNSDERGGRKM